MVSAKISSICFTVLLVAVLGDLLAEGHHQQRQSQSNQIKNCTQNEAPSSEALYIAHEDEPNEPIYFCDAFWSLLKSRTRCFDRRHGSRGENREGNLNYMISGIIKPENETAEDFIFKPWFLNLLIGPHYYSFKYNYQNESAAYINSTHPKHIGKPEPIFVSDSFWGFLTASSKISVADADQCQSKPAMYVRNPGKPEEEIFLTESFCMLLKFLRFN